MAVCSDVQHPNRVGQPGWNVTVAGTPALCQACQSAANLTAVIVALRASLTGNQTVSIVTLAQAIVQIQALQRTVNQLIRLVLNQLDATT